MRNHSPITIDLLLPGLFERLGDWSVSYAEEPEAPFLAAMLRKADRVRQPSQGFEETLARLLDSAAPHSGELPTGCWLSDLEGEVVCCAEPVHLKPGVSDLVLVNADQLALADDEAEALEAMVDAHLRPDGGRFRFRNGLGFLGFDKAPALISTPPSVVAGRGIQAFLPAGEGRRWWHRLLNELQMLMYDSELNRLREQRGKAPVSGLWPWGGGARRPIPAPACDVAIAGDEPLTAQWLRRFDIPVVEDIEAALTMAAGGQGRILWLWQGLQPAAQYDDFALWRDRLRAFDECLRQYLLSDLQYHDWRLNLFSGDWRFSFTPRQRWRFWRRPVALAALAGEADRR